MAMQNPRNILPEMPTEAAFRSCEKGTGRGISPIRSTERMHDRGRACDARPRSHVDQRAAEARSAERGRLHQRKERDPCCTALPKEAAKLRRAAPLGAIPKRSEAIF